MKLLNIKPGSADVTVASFKYGHVERQFCTNPGKYSWVAYNSEGERIGDEISWDTRSQAAESIMRHYRELATHSA